MDGESKELKRASLVGKRRRVAKFVLSALLFLLFFLSLSVHYLSLDGFLTVFTALLLRLFAGASFAFMLRS